MGEYHTTEDWCESSRSSVPIIYFISRIIEGTPENNCLDIFLEDGYKTPGLGPSSAIGTISRMLEPSHAVRRFFNMTPVNNRKGLRVHHSDPRTIDVPGPWYSLPMTMYRIPDFNSDLLENLNELFPKTFRDLGRSDWTISIFFYTYRRS